jgi:single-stranded-DNA-specific exonuclease
MGGLTPRFRWHLAPGVAPTPDLLAAASERGLGSRLVRVLAARGHLDPTALGALFDPPTEGLHDPRLLPDADRFLARITRARTSGERVLVFGDFDADGLTGLAILVTALRALGLDVAPHVPSRVDEGHGLSRTAVERATAEGRTVIVTVDCGSSSVAEVALARAAGIDVLVTDHHRVPDVVPAAAALVNPHRGDSVYPDVRLSGAGVAFKLAQLLLGDSADGRAAALDLADLAAIGTIADVAPLIGENRCIVRLGLARLSADPRPGLAALLRTAGVRPDRIEADTIGFALAPRLNAVGRVRDGDAAARLLLAADAADAESLAGELDVANVERREIMRRCLDEARTIVAAAADAPVTIVVGDWPVGIIGLVAGRLAEDGDRPALVISSSLHPWRGSARSPAGFDLAAAFASCAELFERYGGHAAAAGCELLPDALDALRERLTALAAVRVPREGGPELRLDLVLHAADVDYVLFRELASLDATGDPPALIGIEGLTVTRIRPANGGHVQLTMRKGREVVDAIAFGRADLLDAVRDGAAVDVVARLASRTFGGFESLQLEVRDVAPAGALAALTAPATKMAADPTVSTPVITALAGAPA